jgi:DNA-directed RNA polymerase sigma subunit (sigma70/sigma32)
MSAEELDARLRENYKKAGLTYAEQNVLNLRYGTGDGFNYTLK